MSKISFELRGDYPAPGVNVELDIWTDGGPSQLDFMHAVARDVQQVISNRIRAIAQKHKHETRMRQEAQEREQARLMEVTALEDRLADLKGEKTVAQFQAGADAVPEQKKSSQGGLV